jgi:hypothetical protein
MICMYSSFIVPAAPAEVPVTALQLLRFFVVPTVHPDMKCFD